MDINELHYYIFAVVRSNAVLLLYSVAIEWATQVERWTLNNEVEQVWNKEPTIDLFRISLRQRHYIISVYLTTLSTSTTSFFFFFFNLNM